MPDYRSNDLAMRLVLASGTIANVTEAEVCKELSHCHKRGDITIGPSDTKWIMRGFL